MGVHLHERHVLEIRLQQLAVIDMMRLVAFQLEQPGRGFSPRTRGKAEQQFLRLLTEDLLTDRLG